MNLKNSKEAILNHALAIFGKLGFHKTTMADIAEASKRGRRTIYTYFKNKEEVYEAVVEREIEKVIHEFKNEIEQTELIKNKFYVYINSRLRAIIKLTQNYEALRVAFINNYKWVDKIRKKLDKEEKQILIQLFSLKEAADVFDINQLEISIENIMLMIKGVEYKLIKVNNEKTTQQHIENLQLLLLNGLLKRN